MCDRLKRHQQIAVNTKKYGMCEAAGKLNTVRLFDSKSKFFRCENIVIVLRVNFEIYFEIFMDRMIWEVGKSRDEIRLAIR